ncbi:hypothetical protein FKM82_028438 [Ascaphus truei]
MNSSLSASQIHNVSAKEPLNRVLANLFLLISSILGAKTSGAHTQFVHWFMEECVESLEPGGKGGILQFMPFSMVSAGWGTADTAAVFERRIGPGEGVGEDLLTRRASGLAGSIAVRLQSPQMPCIQDSPASAQAAEPPGLKQGYPE